MTRVYVSPKSPSVVSENEVSASDSKTAKNAEESGALSAAAIPKVPATQAPVSDLEKGYAINFTADMTRDMSNYMLENRFVHTGKTLYGSKHSTDGSPYLCAMKFTAGKNGMYVRETDVIETGIDAKYLILNNGSLYYLRTDSATGETSIVRRPADSEKDDSAPQTLYRGTCDSLFLHGDKLYFTDADSHLISISLDGKTMSQIVSDKAVCYPYLISDSFVLFQDDADGETLHIRYLPTGFDMRISDGCIYEYICSGQYLYYPEEVSDDGRANMCRIDLNEFLESFDSHSPPSQPFGFVRERSEKYMGTRFSINGDHINASNYKTAPLSAWQTLEDDQYEAGYTSACQYVTADFEIFYDYNEDGLIDRVLFYEPAEKRPGYIEIG